MYSVHQKHAASLPLIALWPCSMQSGLGGTASMNVHRHQMLAGQEVLLTSSRVSKRQLLPSSVTSFHHRSPTSSRPATFFVCKSKVSVNLRHAFFTMAWQK